VRIANLNDLAFDDDFGQGNYENCKPLEPDLQRVLSDLEWSDHLVLTTPMWGAACPRRC
jgi:NAD(P)H dehydrogenase (quinone)